MFFSKFGIRAKIFGGLVMVLSVALVIGTIGYFSLNKVVKDAGVNSLALSVQDKLMDARRHEKNYIMRNDNKSYDQLVGVLDEMGNFLPTLKKKADSKQSVEIEKINSAKENYLQAAAEMKRFTEKNALVLNNLQETAGKITGISDEESYKAASKTREAIFEANKNALTENAIKEITNIVAVGHDVLKFYYDSKLSKKDALEALRNLHFDGSNYYFVVREDLTLVAHGSNRKLEGMDFGIIKDKKTGKTFMPEMVKGAIDKGEYLKEYHWTKPGMGNAVFPKISFVKYFKPWGLIIGAGVYVDDIKQKAAEMQAMLDEGLNKLNEANSIESLTLKARLSALYYFKYGTNADKVEKYLSELKDLKIATAELKGTADQYNEDFKRWVANDEQIKGQIQEIVKNARTGLEASGNLANAAQESFEKSASSGKTTILIFILAGAVVGLGLAFILMRAITGPIQQAIEGLQNSSEQVASGSNQVSSTSQQLAEGAAQQAASLEETSSSLEEMSSMTKTNADNANQANNIVSDSKKDMDEANNAMSELTSSMGEISKASEETQKIVKTIDEIAFQTNLLALNAAVEAARAGEAGAGFAVVADEVRNLALRAADAAKNTSDLIEGTVKRVNDGSELVTKTNEAFTQVTAGASKVGELVAEIAAASNEQAGGIEQVNKAVVEMDKVTQQTAANAEESASASEEMNAQAEQMKEIVNELLALVGGNTNGKGYGEISLSNQYQRDVSKNRLFHKGKGTGKELAAPQAKEVTPAQVIPLDDDFKDFQ